MLTFTAPQSSRSNNSNNASSYNSVVDLNEMYTLYQKLTRQLAINAVDLGSFRDNLGTLVDCQLLACSGGNRFTLTVHQSEIEQALQQLGAMYQIADDLVRNNTNSSNSASMVWR